MNSRTPLKAEKEWLCLIRQYGCLICIKAGIHCPGEMPEEDVAIHHINGSTKEGCHFDALGLCSGHHQNSDEALHRNLFRFQEKWGDQELLLKELQECVGYPATGYYRNTVEG